MAKKTYYMTLSNKSIAGCVKWLEEYKKSLQSKTEEFVKRLADVGINVAKNNGSATGPLGTHKMEDRITFTMEVTEDKYGCSGKVIGKGETFVSTWDNGLKSETVYPLHYVEYGTSKNGSMRWSFIDNEGNVFDRATGIKPTQPMYKAYRDMRLQILSIAKEVYGK